MKKKINCRKEKALELANKFGISKETVDAFEYNDKEPPLIHVPANVDPRSIPSAGQLKSFIERIECLEDERKELGSDVREIFAEAKGNGFDAKVMRQILRLRKMSSADRAESEFLIEQYKKLLGIE